LYQLNSELSAHSASGTGYNYDFSIHLHGIPLRLIHYQSTLASNAE